jgi:hypothetical protein
VLIYRNPSKTKLQKALVFISLKDTRFIAVSFYTGPTRPFALIQNYSSACHSFKQQLNSNDKNPE